jgi:hypothetical protein
MSLIVISNVMLGVILGTRFNVMVLLPFVGIPFLELAALEMSEVTWSSTLVSLVLLTAALEYGFVAGSWLITCRRSKESLHGDDLESRPLVGGNVISIATGKQMKRQAGL